MIKRLMMLFLVLMLAVPAMAEEFYPPQADGKGIIGGSSGQAWRQGIFKTIILPNETVIETNVITAAECGSTFYLSAATEFVSTLPTMSTIPTTGCDLDFVVAAAAASADYTILTGNSLENLIYGIVDVASTLVACAAEDTITLVDGNAIGDHVRLRSDGTSWFITGESLTAAKLTCTQAD